MRRAPVTGIAVLAAILGSPGMVARSSSQQLPEFSQWSALCQGIEHTASIALGDLDADGDLDLVFGNGRHFREVDWVYSNDGRGTFYAKRPLSTEPDATYGVALGDVDGDRALDLVVANDIGNRSAVYRNDGKGQFALLASLGSYPGLFAHERRAVALGDLDGDGDLDAVLVGVSQDHIYLNDGQGRSWLERPFGSREAGADARSTGVALGDVDRDGDLDIVLPGRYESRSVVYVNDGKAGFGEAREFGSAADDMTAVALSDLNGDGALDIVAVHGRQPHGIFMNDGKGRFGGARHFGDGGDQSWSVAAADFDGDGDADLVIGNSNVGYWSQDLNNDGRPDRGGNVKGTAPSRIYWNDGHGEVSGGPAVGVGSDDTRPIAVGDLDGDGDIDIVMGNDCQPNHVFFNPLRSARGTTK